MPKPWNDRVRVGASAIGQGVFAARQFRRGQTIGRIEGTVLHSLDEITPYCIELDEIRSLEPAEPFRFLNHRCEPNCEVYSWDEDGERDYLYLMALRTIRPGEELTIDYSWPDYAAIRCKCGADNCRGWVVDPQQLDNVLRREKARRDRRRKRSQVPA